MYLSNDIHQRHGNLQDWYQTPLGKILREQVKTRLNNYIENIFGYYALQLGIIQQEDDFLVNSRIAHHIHADIIPRDKITLIMEYQNLPIATDSLDLAIYLHILELDNQTDIILREAERVLISGGYLVLVGFNALSLTHMMRLLPKNMRNYAVLPLKRLLQQYGFEIIRAETLCFNAPWLGKNYKKFIWLEKISDSLFPALGMLYIVIVRKNELITNIIQPNWQKMGSKNRAGSLVNPFKQN